MLSKGRAKEIAALHHKKFRKESGLFLVEGEKMVDELLHSDFQTLQIIGTADWLGRHARAGRMAAEVTEAGAEELQKISTLSTANQVLAVVKIPEPSQFPEDPGNDLALVLDGIQDPGNLGTIIRTADWFGIGHIICSEDCVEAYNPKVVQASMGGIFRVGVHYAELLSWLPAYKKKHPHPVYGTFTEGEDIFNGNYSPQGLLILGNESKGITEGLQQLVDRKLTIPRFGLSGAESLNVSVATAILCAEFRRRTIRNES